MTTSDQTRRNAVHRVILDVARGGGAEITGHDAAPLGGMQAACVIELEAQSLIRGYIQFARQEGYGWHQIGEALGYSGPGAGFHLGRHAPRGEPVSGTAALPSLPARNDCEMCREHEADVHVLGNAYNQPGKRSLLLCQGCIGKHIALRAVQEGGPACSDKDTTGG